MYNVWDERALRRLGAMSFPQLCPISMLERDMVVTPFPYTSESLCRAEQSQGIPHQASLVGKIHPYCKL